MVRSGAKRRVSNHAGPYISARMLTGHILRDAWLRSMSYAKLLRA